MTRTARFLLVFLALMAFVPLGAQKSRHSVRGQYAAPANTELDRFPKDGQLSDHRLETLGLHMVTLDTAWTGLNWYRNLGRFVYETLPAGTKVWVDETGEVRYKADCLNRLIDFPDITDCPLCLALLEKGGSADAVISMADSIERARAGGISSGPLRPIGYSTKSGDSSKTTSQVTNSDDSGPGFWGSLWNTINRALNPLGILLGVILLLCFLALLLWLVIALINWASRLFRRNPPPTPVRESTATPIPDRPFMSQPANPGRVRMSFDRGQPGELHTFEFGGTRRVTLDDDGVTSRVQFSHL